MPRALIYFIFSSQQDIIIMKNLIRVATNSLRNEIPNSALLHTNGANVGFRKVVNPLRQNPLLNSQKYWKVESKQTSLNTQKINKYNKSGFQGSEDTKIESILKEKKINFSQFKLQQSRVKISAGQIASNQKSTLKQEPTDQNTLKFSYEVQIAKPSQTVIFLKQHYQKLFYNIRNQFPSIKKIVFQFYNKRQSKQIESRIKYNSKIQVTIFGDVNDSSNQNNKKSKIVVKVVKQNYPQQIFLEKQLQLDYQIIPCDLQNSTQVAKILLQKKIWIKISAMLNQVSVYVNDYTPQSGNEAKQIVIPLGLTDHTTWQNQENVFNVNPSSNNQPYKKISLYQLDTMKITYHVEKSQRFNADTISEIISDCHIIKTMQVGKIFSPVLSQNPSLLTNQANKYLLTNQILSLYEYLRTLQINQLPRLGVVDKDFDQEAYYSWRCLRSAMDKSIKTKPAYLIIGNKPKQPIGILNAIMMVKSIDISKGKPNVQNIFRWTQFNFSNYNNFEECLKQMYQKRTCYVRLELQENDATGIGGNIVLQVWPPHCCSSIHNHGQTYGLIKVLANEICVQNFNDLNFLPIDQRPYQNVIYQEGQYTWLSEYSYGIHRLINTTSHLTLSLQAYMGSKGSKEYFEFIVDPTAPLTQKNKYKDSKQKLYIEYYPQNDWRNFLAWPEIVDNNKQWLEIPIVRKLYDYIKQVRQFYQLGNDVKKWDFPHLVLIMKQEYQIYDNLYKGDKKTSIKVQPLQPIV